MDTLLLDTVAWDLVLDASGNIAKATHPYSIAQDVASAVKLFAGELWYDTTQGIPYFDQILGHNPTVSYMTSAIEGAAMTVPDVVSASSQLAAQDGRALTGQIQIIDTTGASNNVQFQ